jgi:hypothetical protein
MMWISEKDKRSSMNWMYWMDWYASFGWLMCFGLMLLMAIKYREVLGSKVPKLAYIEVKSKKNS